MARMACKLFIMGEFFNSTAQVVWPRSAVLAECHQDGIKHRHSYGSVLAECVLATFV